MMWQSFVINKGFRMSALHEKTKDLLKMLGSAIVIAGSSVWVLTHQMNSLTKEMHAMESRIVEKIHEVDTRLGNLISALDKRVTVIETVLIMQGYPIKHMALTVETDKK